MTDRLNLLPHHTIRENRRDGSILLRSGYEPGPMARCTGDWLHKWADAAGDRVFLAQRAGAGWRTLSYANALQDVRAIASHLLDRGLDQNTPILILSGNGVDHGLLSLAAQYAGIPIVPVAEQYSLIEAALPRLDYVVDLVKPALVYAENAHAYSAALSRPVLRGVPVIASDPADSDAVPFETLLTPVHADVDAAFASLSHDTVAKILLTSGSTSDPKGVLTTQGMLCANQAQIADALPFLRARPPVIVDWLPWNHTFGGSYDFNLVLSNGGSLYIDDGKPLKGLFGRTLENLALVSGTISFNVPVGFAQLVEVLRGDQAFARTYFAELDMIFYAGASLPQAIWAELEDLALKTTGRLPLITSSWGLTETAPGAMLQHEPGKGAGIVGVPMTGVEVKLEPDQDARYDVRIKGPNVTPGYFANPDKTREAFDEEGYFITGDVMRFVDPDDANRGMRFDGRLSEDFKLSSGTWVRASALRLEVLAALAPLAQDVVVCGADQEAVSALIIPNREAIAAAGHAVTDEGGILHGESLMAEVAARLADGFDTAGSASRVTRALILSEPPSMGDGEITAKGNLNFARVLLRRADLVDRLYGLADVEIRT